MRGRHFDGRTVEAYLFDGSEKFKKSDDKRIAYDEEAVDNEAEDKKRLEKFSAWIEKDEADVGGG